MQVAALGLRGRDVPTGVVLVTGEPRQQHAHPGEAVPNQSRAVEADGVGTGVDALAGASWACRHPTNTAHPSARTRGGSRIRPPAGRRPAVSRSGWCCCYWPPRLMPRPLRNCCPRSSVVWVALAVACSDWLAMATGSPGAPALITGGKVGSHGAVLGVRRDGQSDQQTEGSQHRTRPAWPGANLCTSVNPWRIDPFTRQYSM